MLDAVIVGSGPNGLAAGVFLARAGHTVHVLESAERIGGGCRTAELTLPGFRHDICAAVHPLGAASPFLRSLPLGEGGLEWIEPPIPLAHPLEGGTAAVLARTVAETADGLGADASAWLRLMEPLASRGRTTIELALGPPLRAALRPVAGARLGMVALQPASRIVRRFRTDGARALFAGLAAHSVAPLTTAATAGVGLVLAAAAEMVGWPVARGGSQAIVDALGALLERAGGEIHTGVTVERPADLPEARVRLLSTTAPQAAALAGAALRARTRRSLQRMRPAPAAFKVDLAVDRPIPWEASACRRAGTVHLGGTFEDIAAAEAAVAAGTHPERPFVLVSQPSLFDASRAPAGAHTVWAYCHVPRDSDRDMTEAIIDQIERFAPGFRGTILAAHSMAPRDLEAYNPSYPGGDITGGAVNLRQVLFRPRVARDPYRIGPDVWLCSSATPPGAGVHGMCGYHAARSAAAALHRPP